MTPLHFAVESGNMELVQLLLSFNVAATASCRADGDTPLHFAAKNGHAELCEILMKYDDVRKPGLGLRMLGITVPAKMKNFCNHTPIAYAVQEGHADVVDVFLRSKRLSPRPGMGIRSSSFMRLFRRGITISSRFSLIMASLLI